MELENFKKFTNENVIAIFYLLCLIESNIMKTSPKWNL